jgi:hypothetical protein
MSEDRIQPIIDAVGAPVLKPHRTWHGVDLTGHKASLDALMQEIAEVYDAALDDWKSRNSNKPFDPLTGEGKPAKKLSRKGSKQAVAACDYGEDAGAGFSGTWEEHWQRFYGRRAGHPTVGFNRVPLAPLEVPYWMLRQWWLAKVGKPWRPTYADGDNVSKMNPAGRLFLLVAQEVCDPNYQAANCHSVYSRLRELPQKKKRRADGQRERIKRARGTK